MDEKAPDKDNIEREWIIDEITDEFILICSKCNGECECEI